LDGGAGKSPQITLRLPSDTYDRVVAAAAKAGESVSALVRDAVDRQLSRLERTSRR
jgi:predicted DNA-binding protein